ncbi:hypothetical protein MKX03_001972, partial [Papaver bracteatum]
HLENENLGIVIIKFLGAALVCNNHVRLHQNPIHLCHSALEYIHTSDSRCQWLQDYVDIVDKTSLRDSMSLTCVTIFVAYVCCFDIYESALYFSA